MAVTGGSGVEKEMKRYSVWHALVLSFYSPALYRDVARRWIGTGLGYLFLLLALVWVPSMVLLQKELLRDAKEAPFVLAQIPDVHIVNGQASTDVNTPYFIRRPDQTVLAIIDFTGKYTSLENTPAKLLLTKDHIVAKNGPLTRSMSLENLKQFHFDRATAQQWWNFGLKWLVILLYFFSLGISYIYRAVEVLIYALMGMVFAKFLHVVLDYRALLRLAIVAVTPAIVLGTLRTLGAFNVPDWGLISFLLAMSYLLFGVWANTSEAEGASEKSPAD